MRENSVTIFTANQPRHWVLIRKMEEMHFIIILEVLV